MTRPYDYKNVIIRRNEDLSRMVASPDFCGLRILGKNFVLAKMKKDVGNLPDVSHNITVGSYIYAHGRICLRKKIKEIKGIIQLYLLNAWGKESDALNCS